MTIDLTKEELIRRGSVRVVSQEKKRVRISTLDSGRRKRWKTKPKPKRAPSAKNSAPDQLERRHTLGAPVLRGGKEKRIAILGELASS